MRKCVECGKMFDDSGRTGDKWKKVYAELGAAADQCNACLLNWYFGGVRK